jgi:hypothetical protein
VTTPPGEAGSSVAFAVEHEPEGEQHVGTRRRGVGFGGLGKGLESCDMVLRKGVRGTVSLEIVGERSIILRLAAKLLSARRRVSTAQSARALRGTCIGATD